MTMSSKVIRTARKAKKQVGVGSMFGPEIIVKKKPKQDPEYEELISTIASIERACGRLRELVIGRSIDKALAKGKR